VWWQMTWDCIEVFLPGFSSEFNRSPSGKASPRAAVADCVAREVDMKADCDDGEIDAKDRAAALNGDLAEAPSSTRSPGAATGDLEEKAARVEVEELKANVNCAEVAGSPLGTAPDAATNVNNGQPVS